MAKGKTNLVVIKDEGSFTGYSIINLVDGAGLPATIWEIELWNKIQELIAEIKELRKDELAVNNET